MSGAASRSSTSGPRTSPRRPPPAHGRAPSRAPPGSGTGKPSHIAKLSRSPYGQLWTGRSTPCHASVMSRAGVALVSRRHVDLVRVSSAICPAR
ncbi:putative leader peptide [Streptomyces orinoci]